jgi:hypothetical protein
VKGPHENTPKEVLPRMFVKQIVLVDVVLKLCNADALLVDGGCVISDDEFLLPHDYVFRWFVHVCSLKNMKAHPLTE